MARMRRALMVLALTAATSIGGAAHAEIQKWGPQVWPGRYQVGFHPFGAQVRFDGLSTGGYHMDIDFSLRFVSFEKFAMWVGGGFNWAHPSYSCRPFNSTGCAHDFQLWAFLMITFEKLIRFPLVPFVQAGIGGDILPYTLTDGTTETGAALAIRLGGGVHYWLIKNLGLGLESHFTAGPGFYPTRMIVGSGTGTTVASYGNWDIVFGARAAF
jgi:hypothetical protein